MENPLEIAVVAQSVAVADARDYSACVITGAQIRAARGLLGWSADELARRASISYSTVQRAETASGIPSVTARNLGAIQRPLEMAGVEFLTESDSAGAGVRLRRS